MRAGRCDKRLPSLLKGTLESINEHANSVPLHLPALMCKVEILIIDIFEL